MCRLERLQDHFQLEWCHFLTILTDFLVQMNRYCRPACLLTTSTMQKILVKSAWGLGGRIPVGSCQVEYAKWDGCEPVDLTTALVMKQLVGLPLVVVPGLTNVFPGRVQ